MLIPERAIERDKTGTFVYVVDQQNRASRRNVVLGTKSGNLIVIESGLNSDDRVIVDGIQRVRPGTQVAPESVE